MAACLHRGLPRPPAGVRPGRLPRAARYLSQGTRDRRLGIQSAGPAGQRTGVGPNSAVARPVPCPAQRKIEPAHNHASPSCTKNARICRCPSETIAERERRLTFVPGPALVGLVSSHRHNVTLSEFMPAPRSPPSPPPTPCLATYAKPSERSPEPPDLGTNVA